MPEPQPVLVGPVSGGVESGSASRPRRSIWRRAGSPLVFLSALFVLIVMIMALVGPLMAPSPPAAQDLTTGLAGPSPQHLLGTDNLGRDIASRIIVGARTAVLGPFVVAIGAALISTLIGLFSGFHGGRRDTLIMRGVDLALALPAMLILVVVAGIASGGYWFAVAVLTALAIPWDTRIIRAATLEQVPRPYIEATKVLGLSPRRVMWRHLFPNVLPLVIVDAGVDFATSLVLLAGLSFLGLGVGPGTADWGRMLFENRELLLDNPWAALAPALMIVFTAAAVNILADRAYEWTESRGADR
jgi:peptide/nickel transport system permease protein